MSQYYSILEIKGVKGNTRVRHIQSYFHGSRYVLISEDQFPEDFRNPRDAQKVIYVNGKISAILPTSLLRINVENNRILNKTVEQLVGSLSSSEVRRVDQKDVVHMKMSDN